jgi:type IV pilus assembly protein PilW
VLVAMAVVLVVTGAALSLALSSRSLYEKDESRTELLQSLRVSLDLLGTDIRQAGERLPEDFPALVIVDGPPDQIAVRRNLIDTVLPVCRDVGTTDEDIFVADLGGAPPLPCNPLPDADADGWRDNLQAWRTYRLANGGAVPAYIYDPVTGNGEFITYDDEDAAGMTIHRDDLDALLFTYPVANGSRVYILEERLYGLDTDMLQITLNGNIASPMHVVQHLTGFQAWANFQDGSVQQTLGAPDVWSDLRSIEIQLDGRVDNRGELVTRTLTAEFFPRNVLSR